MNDKSANGVHWSFWIIGVVALAWNAMGVANFFVQMNPDALSSFPESHRAIIEGRPAWATAAFGLGVIAGTLACFVMLLRKSASIYLFLVSLLGVIVTMTHTLRVAGSTSEFGPFEVAMMMVMPLLVAAALVWYSISAKRRRWIS